MGSSGEGGEGNSGEEWGGEGRGTVGRRGRRGEGSSGEERGGEQWGAVGREGRRGEERGGEQWGGSMYMYVRMRKRNRPCATEGDYYLAMYRLNYAPHAGNEGESSLDRYRHGTHNRHITK